jgi:hypothetical protein
MTRLSGVRVMFVGTALVACASPRLPPGTPPPEYEMRTYAPWPPASAPSAAPAPAPVVGPEAPSGPGTPSATQAPVGDGPSPAAPSE